MMMIGRTCSALLLQAVHEGEIREAGSNRITDEPQKSGSITGEVSMQEGKEGHPSPPGPVRVGLGGARSVVRP